MSRLMRLPSNSQHPNYKGLHLEDDWCKSAGCTPVTSINDKLIPDTQVADVGEREIREHCCLSAVDAETVADIAQKLEVEIKDLHVLGRNGDE